MRAFLLHRWAQIGLQRCDPDTSSLDMRPWYISIHSNNPFSTELSKNITTIMDSIDDMMLSFSRTKHVHIFLYFEASRQHFTHPRSRQTRELEKCLKWRSVWLSPSYKMFEEGILKKKFHDTDIFQSYLDFSEYTRSVT